MFMPAGSASAASSTNLGDSLRSCIRQSRRHPLRKSPCGEDSLAGYVPKMISSIVGIYNGKVCRLVMQACNCLRLMIGVQLCGDQARDDGPLLGRVQYLIQACQAQSSWYW